MSNGCAGRQSLAATVLACLAVVAASAGLIDGLTDGLRHWTFEDVRRDKASRRLLAAAPIEVRTARDTRRTLWSTRTAPRRVMLVDFVYTRCPTVCRALGTEFAGLQRLLIASGANEKGSIELLSLSFDVQRDTPAQLAVYARLQGTDDKIWTIAAPLSQEATDRALRELGIVVIPDGTGGYMHNGSIHVITSDGRVLAIFDEGEGREALAFARRAVEAAR